MGEISKRLHKKLAGKAGAKLAKQLRQRPGEPLPAGITSVASLIEKGFGPVHAVYTFIQQVSSFFAEQVSTLPEMKEYAKIVGKAEEEYMPSGPPYSPLTVSYFTSWAFYDLQFGRDGDTLARCQIDANDLLQLNPEQLAALENISASRMGIYEHVGPVGSHLRLKELVTGQEIVCQCIAGYQGRKGELWYVRLLPPLLPYLADPHITFTTPYILIQSSKQDWLKFFERILPATEVGTEAAQLHRLMKAGPDRNYWNEFVLKAYHHHQHDAIFLAGIPDLEATLPH